MLCRQLSVMDRQRWDPVVISLTDGSAPEAWLREQGIPVHCLGMRAGKLPGPAMFMKLRRLVRMIRPDLIQGWMYHGNLAAQFARCCLSWRTPVIWTIHHSIGSLTAEKPMTKFMIWLGAKLSGLPDKIVYASQVSAEQHRALGYRADKGIVIPYGVDPGFFLPSAEAGITVRAALGLSPDDLVIGSLARYHPMKDHENFLRAAALLLGRYAEGQDSGMSEMRFENVAGVRAESNGPRPRLRFLLAGTGVDTGNVVLESLIQELGLADRVLLLGERGDVPPLLAALDIFTVSSSRGEALPIALLEAMSCGLPCVTTDVGDAALLVGDSGRVVGVSDPEELAAAWAELIAGGEEKRKWLGEAARARILAHYTLSANASAYDELYRELVDSTGNLWGKPGNPQEG